MQQILLKEKYFSLKKVNVLFSIRMHYNFLLLLGLIVKNIKTLMTVIIKILGTNQNEFPSSKQYTTERDLTIVVVILSVFSFILVSGIIVYVIWRIKGPYLSNWRSFRDVTPIREHYTPQKATSQQHASLDMSQRTDDTYCSSYDARPFQYFNHAMNVSTDDISPQAHGKVPQRDGSAKTILFDISSSYGPDIHTIQKDKF